MNTIGKDKWPTWIIKIIGNEKNIEVKEDNGRYYAYKSKSVWDKNKKCPTRTSKYLGVIKQHGLVHPHELKLNGIYEYGHINFLWELLERNKIISHLKKIYPDDWKIILIFAMNRIIDPRPIKSINSWYEKTYLVKKLNIPISPKIISRVLETCGLSWKSQTEFFDVLKKEEERILYDGSVIFSSSKENSLLEVGYNKEHLFLTKTNIVLAFSHDRFIPVFFRLLPGSIRDSSSIEVLLEELGDDVTLILDKGFQSEDTFSKLNNKIKFIIPLRRNSKKIKYKRKFDSHFMYRERPIKYTSYNNGKFFIYLYEDLTLRIEEEKTYFNLLSKGKKVEFKEEWAGKIALISNQRSEPEKIYEMWKSRDQIEKCFDVLQNILDTDRPHVRKEETFRGYLFGSFIALLIYYMVLNLLKKAQLNKKISVADCLLEFSKVYKIEINDKELITERSKRVKDLAKKLKVENIITK